MKKLILIASALLLSANVYAQHDVGTFTVQPKIGFNIANYNGSEDSDSRFGLATGAEFEYQMTDKFSMSAGILYSMQGAKDSENIQGYKAKGTIKTDYINIPILANIYVIEGLALKIGIQPAFNVKADCTVSMNGVTVTESLSDMGVDIKSFDFSIPFGISYEYNNFVIEGRYNLGVMKIADMDNDDTKNSVFQFTVGYKFEL